MKVSVVWASATVQDVVVVELPAGSIVADAIARSGLVAHHGLDPARLGYAIFGRAVSDRAPIADGDRVEITRALVADPKELRRRRVRTVESGAPSLRPRRQRAV